MRKTPVANRIGDRMRFTTIIVYAKTLTKKRAPEEERRSYTLPFAEKIVY